MANFYLIGAPINAASLNNTYLSKYVGAVGSIADSDAKNLTIDTDTYSGDAILSYQRKGNAAEKFTSYRGAAYNDGGYVRFVFNNATPQIGCQYTLYNYDPEDDSKPSLMGLGTTPTQCPAIVLDLAKLYGVSSVTDDTLEKSKTIVARIREVLGSNDPATLVDSGIVIPSALQYFTEQQGTYPTEYGSYTWGLCSGDWDITDAEHCDTTFGTSLAATQTDCYAVVANDLALYYWYTGVAPIKPAHLSFDFSQVPTGLNVSSQLDLETGVDIDAITKENSDITFTLDSEHYEYTGETEYSTNNRDWYSIQDTMFPGEHPQKGTDIAFNVSDYVKTYSVSTDTTFYFRGYVKKKDTPQPTPSATTNSIFEITEQDLHDLRGIVIAHISQGEVEYTDLSAYVVACFTMYGTLPETTPKIIYLGNTSTNVEGGFIDGETLHVDCGSIDLTGVDAQTADADVWLPFDGFMTVKNCIGHVVSLTYDMHLSNGEGMYVVSVDGVPVDSKGVKNGFELPLRITTANVQAQSSNPLDLAERKPFATVQAATAWVKGGKHDAIAVSGVPCTSREREMLESIIKDGVIA